MAIAAKISNTVRLRITQGDHKGRAFGTPRNPSVPTIEQFNPRVTDIVLGELEALIVARKHGIFPDRAEIIARLSNDELVEFRLEDPISATVVASGLALTGGHHRTNELLQRARSGRINPDLVVRILLHD